MAVLHCTDFAVAGAGPSIRVLDGLLTCEMRKFLQSKWEFLGRFLLEKFDQALQPHPTRMFFIFIRKHEILAALHEAMQRAATCKNQVRLQSTETISTHCFHSRLHSTGTAVNTVQ